MNVLIWHVHGSWMTAFVHGPHTYYVPLVEGRGPEGRGRAQTWEWPASAVEIEEAQACETHFDVVVFQRPQELALAPRWLGDRLPGRDLPAIYVEHNAPRGNVPDSPHPLTDRDDFTLVHVTHFNALFWGSGRTPTRVIEHGIPDPGYRYGGSLRRTAVVINEPRRRWRVSGTDLLPHFASSAPIDLFGIGAGAFGGIENLPQDRLHAELAERRVYLHPFRWTSLGLSLIEAMQLGMPVVALATTEAPSAIPPRAGAVSTDVRALNDALRAFHDDPAAAREAGACGREYARARYGLARFHRDWDALLAEVTA